MRMKVLKMEYLRVAVLTGPGVVAFAWFMVIIAGLAGMANVFMFFSIPLTVIYAILLVTYIALARPGE